MRSDSAGALTGPVVGAEVTPPRPAGYEKICPTGPATAMAHGPPPLASMTMRHQRAVVGDWPPRYASCVRPS